jgi:hypothetical protein
VAFKVGRSLLIVNFGGLRCSSFLFLFPTAILKKKSQKTEKEKGRDEDTRNNRLKPKIK